MALPGVPQTFAIENTLDMSEKLWWEIEAYRNECDLQPKLWRAFNCAVTAWHISDWLYKERKAEGLDVGKEVGNFQNALLNRSRELRLCKQIATASKHGGVDRSPDLAIQVTVRPKDTPDAVGLTEVDRSQNWEIMISDDSGESDALQIFYKALEFWDAEIRSDEQRRDPQRYTSCE